MFNNKGNNKSNNKKTVCNELAQAAYNFIALPDKILPAELDDYRQDLLSADEDRIHDAFETFLKEKGKLSGHIDLALKTLTPLFIGGNGEQPFSPAGRIIIPGSTIRGMVKNILKIVSCGSWHGDEDINDRHVYFRCLMATKSSQQWMHDLHKLYSQRMMTGKTKNTKMGILAKDKKGNYFVYPLLPNKAPKRILIREYERKFLHNVSIEERGSSTVAWHDDKAYIITGSQGKSRLIETQAAYDKLSKDQKQRAGKQMIRYFSLKEVDWSNKHRFAVPDSVINDYVEDTNRSGVNLLERKDVTLSAAEAKSLGAKVSDDISSLITCGYLAEKNEITAFGHGLSFRIPYKNGIMAAVPADLQQDTIDFATAIFGNKERWASRVFFEDAEPNGTIDKLATNMAHPLLQPNPTSYQLYLQQDKQTLKHWDSKGAKIRGYKLYWHNKMDSDWQATPDEIKNKNVVRKITPIKPNSKFQAKIRFQNLSALELGALLMVFDLAGANRRSAYKIGQGKSLGLGSIEIKSKLYLDTNDTYTTLFRDGEFSENAVPDDGKAYLECFEKYVVAEGLERCWQQTMKELAEMLDWTNANKTPGWADHVKSMSGNVQSQDVDERFKTRAILPTVDEVYKNARSNSL